MTIHLPYAESARIIQEHYGLDSQPNRATVAREIDNLIRKAQCGTMDDLDEMLAVRLGIE